MKYTVNVKRFLQNVLSLQCTDESWHSNYRVLYTRILWMVQIWTRLPSMKWWLITVLTSASVMTSPGRQPLVRVVHHSYIWYHILGYVNVCWQVRLEQADLWFTSGNTSIHDAAMMSPSVTGHIINVRPTRTSGLLVGTFPYMTLLIWWALSHRPQY